MGTLDPKLSEHLSISAVFSWISGDIQNYHVQSISNTYFENYYKLNWKYRICFYNYEWNHWYYEEISVIYKFMMYD